MRPSNREIMRELERHFIHEIVELQGELAHFRMIDLAKLPHGQAPEALEQLRFGLFKEVEVLALGSRTPRVK